MLDIGAVRRDFPFLAQCPVPVYLDNAATSHKPYAVVDAVQSCYTNMNANVYRGGYTLARRVTRRFEEARATVAAFIGAPTADEVVFTKNATEALNLVASVLAWADPPLRVTAGDNIVLSDMEHVANIIPWQLLAQRTGATITYLGISEDGRLDLSQLDEVITSRTKVVSITHVSNTLGTVNPLTAIVERAHQVGALVVVDAAQSVPHQRLDVATLGADLVSFTGHKMCGPTGIGVLWGRRSLLAALPPFMGGGGMNEEVTHAGTRFARPPRRFEAGTPPIAQAIGLGAAVSYLDSVGMHDIAAHEHELITYALRCLEKIDGLTIIGPSDSDHHAAIVSFLVDGLDPAEVGRRLDRVGIAVRTGRHCAHLVCAHYCVPATVRASFYLYNSIAEVDALVTAITSLQAEGSRS